MFCYVFYYRLDGSIAIPGCTPVEVDYKTAGWDVFPLNRSDGGIHMDVNYHFCYQPIRSSVKTDCCMTILGDFTSHKLTDGIYFYFILLLYYYIKYIYFLRTYYDTF